MLSPQRDIHGIIPAHAGFTVHLVVAHDLSPDHPRTRGVYHGTRGVSTVRGGSSPHTRGLLRCQDTGIDSLLDHPRTRGVYGRGRRGRVRRGWIIPAHAGFTVPLFALRYHDVDHPRTRGVYAESIWYCMECAGSSPRVRGLLVDDGGGDSGGGIIPACAGFTAHTTTVSSRRADHPRMRGVYAPQLFRARRWTGSSPHARGLRRGRGRRPARGRIIPACAGFTGPGGPGWWSWPDHPRMRGVYPLVAPQGVLHLGSSPHARGLHTDIIVGAGIHRIIPACAGFTPVAQIPKAFGLDHPRMRGVYRSADDRYWYFTGSSPHARGLLGTGGVATAGVRIIPACAGFTRAAAARSRGWWDHPRMRGVYVVRGQDC